MSAPEPATRRELLLLRHGKSDWSEPAESDRERALTGRGKRACKRIGRWLAEHRLVPDCVLASPAARARDTARRTLRAMGSRDRGVICDERIYEGSADTLRDVLRDLDPRHARVLLVGHNPGLEDLVRYLAPDVTEPDDGKLMPTAALCRLRLPGDWRALPRGCAEVVAIIRPRTLLEP